MNKLLNHSLRVILLSFTILLIDLPHATAQFDKLKKLGSGLKNSGAMKKLKNATSSKLMDKLYSSRDKYDSTSFNYSIAQVDNASRYAAKDKTMLKLLTFLKDSDEMSEAEKTRRYLDTGELLYAQNRYTQAEAVFKTAKLQYELNELTDDPNYLKVISNLGLLYNTMGRYRLAEEFIVEALSLRREKLGEISSGYGSSLTNLAVLYHQVGRFNEAEVESKKALDINKQVHGEESMPYAISLNNQAMLFTSIGRYDEAESLMKRTISISEKQQSAKSGNHQKFLSNMAHLYQQSGQYEKSEKAFKELIKVKEKRFGKNDPDYAHLLNNLASLYMDMERYGEVEELLIKSNEIYENKFGDEHPVYAKGLGDLGNFYRFQGKFDEAEPLLTTALGIEEKALGSTHPTYVQTKEDMAILHWNRGEVEKASELYLSCLESSMEFIKSYFPPMSEAEKTRFWDQLRPRFERFYSFVRSNYRQSKVLVDHAYNYHVSTKGLLLSSSNKIKNKILTSGDDSLIKDYTTWVDQKELLATYYNYSKEELKEQNVNRDSLENAANSMEKSLSERSDIFSEGFKIETASIDKVKAKVKQDEAVVELMRVRNFNNRFTNEVTYLAVILRANESVKLVSLDNGAQLETRYYKYYNNAIHKKFEDEYSYQQFWLPIESEIADKRVVYLAPDGIYSQINVNTLEGKDGKHVLSRHQIRIVGNSSTIHQSGAGKKSKSSVLIGNPEFGSSDIAQLPGTKVELANVSRMLKGSGYKTLNYQGTSATEANIKSVKSPGILHIATHGYFLEDEKIGKNKVFGVSAESAKDNPLLRSGILLTDAGKTLKPSAAGMESSNNGVLTAYEAINMDLDNTSMVILSACETGNGDIKAGEGVYGLQRAFLAAGADALIMSLWKVSDEATQELMTKFYKYWLRYGDKHRAFNLAQTELLTKYKDPYFWGAFVMVEK